MAEKKVDEALIEKLRNGQLFEDKPKETEIGRASCRERV